MAGKSERSKTMNISDELDLEVELVDFQTPVGFFEALSSVVSDQSYSLGRGFGEGLVNDQPLLLR